MNLNEYQNQTINTAIYPHAGTGSKEEFAYLGLGLVDEGGEVAGKIKKYLRDNTLSHDDFIKELGDVFWYLCRLCSVVGVQAEEVLTINALKLQKRQAQGVLSGSGDNR